jgi:arylesterase/paraoxonase
MAVNHPAWPSYEGSTVEIFDIPAGGAPVWRRSVKGAWLRRPNDVEPVGPDLFYVTHESDAAAGSAGELWGWATGADRTGAVFYFDGREGRRVADGMTFANSVSVSADGSLLFATSTLSGHLHVYRRDATTGALSDLRRHFIGRGPDNIDRTTDGVLTVAMHPAMLRFLWHAADAARRSPVRVAEITDPGSAAPPVRDVFASDGASFSAASVAVRMDDKLILGAVYDDGVAICPVGSS